jgi:GT2 family glycosyltransferase
MAEPHLAVVILHWGSPDVTARCLDALRAAVRPGRVTVLVVDNTTRLDDDVATRAAPLPVRILRPERNLGFADGSSLGMSVAVDQGADWVLLLNNDAVVDPEFLDPLVSAAVRCPEAGLLSPQIVYLDRPEEAWYQGGTFSLWSGIPGQGNHRRVLARQSPVREVEYATGCAMLVRRALIERVGAFDGRFFAYCEDVDLSVRARGAGFRVLFVPASIVFHDVRDDEGRAALRLYYSTRNLLEVMRKHAPWYKWFGFAMNFLARWVGLFAARAVVRRQPRDLTALSRGMIDFATRRLGPCAWVDDARASHAASVHRA